MNRSFASLNLRERGRPKLDRIKRCPLPLTVFLGAKSAVPQVYIFSTTLPQSPNCDNTLPITGYHRNHHDYLPLSAPPRAITPLYRLETRIRLIRDVVLFSDRGLYCTCHLNLPLLFISCLETCATSIVRLAGWLRTQSVIQYGAR